MFRLLVAPAGSGFEKVVAGSNRGSLFLKSDGSLWGAGSYLGGEDPYRDLGPRQLDAGPVTSYSTGGYHSGNYALWTRPDGSLWAVGISYYGRFGNGNANQYTFNDPQQLLSTGVSAVAAGFYHSLIVKEDGSLWAAGQNGKGQLGNGTTEDHDIWVKVVDANVTKVYARSLLACFSKMTALFGEWVTTERANWEMLIPPIDFHRCNPTCLKWLMLALKWATYALKSDGSLWKTNKNAVNGWELVVDANVTSIDGGGLRANIVYTKTDGSLWTLGSNEHGEFGNGTYE